MPMVLNIFFFFNTTKSVRLKSLNLQEMFVRFKGVFSSPQSQAYLQCSLRL